MQPCTVIRNFHASMFCVFVAYSFFCAILFSCVILIILKQVELMEVYICEIQRDIVVGQKANLPNKPCKTNSTTSFGVLRLIRQTQVRTQDLVIESLPLIIRPPGLQRLFSKSMAYHKISLF